MNRAYLRAVAVVALSGLCAPVFAQTAADDDGASEWTAFVPPAASTASAPGSPIGPTTPEGGFSAPDRVIFSEKMRERVLDQLCRNIKGQYDYHLPGDFSGTGGGMKRWLAPLPDGRLTVVDEETVRVGYGHTLSKVLESASGVTGGLWLGGQLTGSSMVIRPLEGKQTCKELDTLIDVRDIKTVLPFKGERITAMKVGELWRLPFTLTVGHTESLGDVLADKLNLSLSFNGTENGAATLTLYRLSESQLRFRFRIDRVEIRTKGGNLVEAIPAIAFPSLGANILFRLIDHEIAGQLSRYTSALFAYSRPNTAGKKVVLEYVVDPRDPNQAEAVAKALHGDFEALVKMGWDLGTQQATDASTEAAYRRMMAKHDAELGPASFAAISAYAQKANSIPLRLPFLTNQNWTNLTGEETVTRYTDIPGHMHFDRADKSRTSEYVDVPIVGPLFKNNSQRDVQVVTAAKEGDAYGDPIVIYLQQHGFLRATESSVREKVQQFHDIMALAGTRGNGPNEKMAVPMTAFPEPPAPAANCGRDDCPAPSEPSNRKGSVAFTLVFNQEAVKQLTHASVDDIVRSYAATVDSVPAMKWLMANGTYDAAKGEYAYDWRAARKAFPKRDEEAGNRSYEEGEIEHMAKQAAGLIADLAAARDASDNSVRSAALAKAFGGDGESGLAYEQALRVFVQLVDPMNLTGDFVASVDRPKKETDVNVHLVLKKNRGENELLNLAGEARARFATPSILTD